MANEILGTVECAHCGNKAATVHKEKRGGALYYKCYGGPDGDCGTIQCRGKAGQAYINKRAVWTNPEPADPVPENPTPAPEPTDPEPTRHREPANEGGLKLSKFLNAIFTD